MTLLVTGGMGFVLSHVVRQWLEQHEAQEAVVVDRAGFDASAEVFFAPVRARMRVVQADVVGHRRPGPQRSIRPKSPQLVNGAALSPITNDPALEPGPGHAGRDRARQHPGARPGSSTGHEPSRVCAGSST